MKHFLALNDIFFMHETLINKYGGSTGIRDSKAVEAAMARPQCGYYRDTIEEAVAILESLLINHPFVDGNKRTAFAACYVYLRLNGLKLEATPDWLYSRIIAWIEKPRGRFEAMSADLRMCVSHCQG